MVTAALAQTLFSIGYVGGLLAAAWGCAHVAHQRGLPKGQRLLYFWLMFDALIHVFLEGPFVWLSLQGRTVETSHGFFASVWQEYSYADRRWAVADAGIVSVELLTVVLTGPLAAYTAWLVLRRDAGYHVWLVLLCGAELYGDYMTFVPEWLTNAPSLSTDNPLHLYFYLMASNSVWVCGCAHPGCCAAVPAGTQQPRVVAHGSRGAQEGGLKRGSAFIELHGGRTWTIVQKKQRTGE
ncbi:GDP-Man:Man3GlcNAc2-PP-dolichol alpha-1,2-mannosyltransferase [Malassezia furfur]|uniref:GDP-Man:Man3GlcNAc2-PP-dolichol alpha-1,2-mannosyltransferase n=1 Tax=Malassezia furfur TaxID=55194 RepID=A0ABY8EWA4_MALFU|nr:GDP-Man:Man3GlcNAc2-PP-dolichol alpha-1,2-mannosyltransferase [Malassezia furfur]